MSALAYSRATAAEATTLSEDEIDRAIREGRLRAKKQGRRVVIAHSALERFIDSLDDYEPRASS